MNKTNAITKQVAENLTQVGMDIKEMQKLADKLEEKKQTKFLEIIEEYNTVLRDIATFSSRNRPHILSVKRSIKLKNSEMFAKSIGEIEFDFIPLISSRIADICTKITNFSASLKVDCRNIYKDWKLWLSVAVGGITAIGAILTLGLTVWVELAIGLGIVALFGAGGATGLIAINKYQNKKRIEHLEELKSILGKANDHILDVKDVLKQIGDKLGDFIQEMFNDSDFPKTVDDTIDALNSLDDLLRRQIM